MDKLQLSREKLRRERLLGRMLPKRYVDDTGKMVETTIEAIGDATIVFIDIVGFTQKTNNLHPEIILNLLNRLFVEFDKSAELYGIEKLKTMGDSYIAGSGIGDAETSGPVEVARFALEALEATKTISKEIAIPLEVRIGIATGPVVAGILAVKRPTFDVIGETVNLAARLQSYADPGKVLVSSHTYSRLKHDFKLEKSPVENVRGFGVIETFYVTGTRGST